MTEQDILTAFYDDIKSYPPVPLYPEYTLGWYLSQLDNDNAEKAIQYTIDQGGESVLLSYNDNDKYTLEHFLRYSDYAFTWDETPEGHSYWSEVLRKLIDKFDD